MNIKITGTVFQECTGGTNSLAVIFSFLIFSAAASSSAATTSGLVSALVVVSSPFLSSISKKSSPQLFSKKWIDIKRQEKKLLFKNNHLHRFHLPQTPALVLHPQREPNQSIMESINLSINHLISQPINTQWIQFISN